LQQQGAASWEAGLLGGTTMQTQLSIKEQIQALKDRKFKLKLMAEAINRRIELLTEEIRVLETENAQER